MWLGFVSHDIIAQSKPDKKNRKQ